MAVGGDAEGLLEMYLFKPFSGLDAVGVYRGLPPPSPPSLSLNKVPSPAPKPGPDYFQSRRDNLAASCFLPMYLISNTWRHNPLMGTSALLLRGR